MPTPKKPAALHALTGTKSQAAVDDSPDFASGRPKMPADLPPLAEQEWRRLCPKLCKRKTLTKGDASALEIYCRMYSRWRKVADIAEADPLERVSWLDTNGKEHSKTVESAASKCAARLEASLRNFLMQFGGTPVTRSKTQPPKPESEPAQPLPTRDETPPIDDTPDVDIWALDETQGGTL